MGDAVHNRPQDPYADGPEQFHPAVEAAWRIVMQLAAGASVFTWSHLFYQVIVRPGAWGLFFTKILVGFLTYWPVIAINAGDFDNEPEREVCICILLTTTVIVVPWAILFEPRVERRYILLQVGGLLSIITISTTIVLCCLTNVSWLHLLAVPKLPWIILLYLLRLPWDAHRTVDLIETIIHHLPTEAEAFQDEIEAALGISDIATQNFTNVKLKMLITS